MALATLFPPASSGLETSDNLSTVPYLAQRVLPRVRRHIWGPGAIDAQNATGPANLLSQGTGTAAIAEINSSEICGVTFDADSESVGFLWGLPDIIDLSEAIYIVCIWANSTAAVTGSAKFSLVYTPITVGTTALAIGATALDTVIADDADSATAYAVQETEIGQIAASTLSGKPGVDYLACKVAVDLTTVTDATLLGVVCEFARRFI